MTLILNLLKSVIYGIVQGITEWLPVSSEAHFALMRAFMPLNVLDDFAANQAFWNLYCAWVPLGCAAAVCVLYRNRLNPFQPGIGKAKKNYIFRLWLMLAAASLPGALLGFFFSRAVRTVLSSPLVTAASLAVIGALMIVLEKKGEQPITASVGQMTLLQAFLAGCGEVSALIPGVSRSAAVMLAGRTQKISLPAIAEFYLYLSIPAILGGAVLASVQSGSPLGLAGFLVILFGCVGSFLSSAFAIRLMMKFVHSHDLRLFGGYRIALAAVLAVMALFRVIA